MPPQPATLSRGATLFCDFDGPIADVSDRYYNTYKLAIAATQAAYATQGLQLPIRILSKAQFWHMKQNRIPDLTIADWSGLVGDEVLYFMGQVEQLVNQPALLHQDRLQPGVREALVQLQAQGIRLVIVTLRQSAQVLQFLQAHELATAVSQIYGATDDATAYPNRVEHKVAQLRGAIADQARLGYAVDPTWMIGDTEADICAGQAAGIPTIGLACGIRSRDYLSTLQPTYLRCDLNSAIQTLLQLPSPISINS
jgi:phosphoglycolate phosphatase